MTIVHFIFLACILTVTILIFLNFAIMVYVAHRKIDYIESLLLNCASISGEKKLWLHAGLLGKVLRLSNISFMLLTPKIFARKNLIDIKEINNLPSEIKTPLIIIGAVQLILTIAFFGLCILTHYLPPLSK
ncbi:hypothetical protein DM807_21925 [Pseudomonas hunanensis]|nr:hypothetical protein [Pseudomonas hunanensis]